MLQSQCGESSDRDEESTCQGSIREDRSNGSEKDVIPPVEHKAQADSGEPEELCRKGCGNAGFGTEEADMDSVSESERETPEDIRQSRNQENRKGNRHRRMVRGAEGKQIH